MAAKVFIDGEAGTTGLGIAQRLKEAQGIELLRLDTAHRKDPAARREAMEAADVTILCLPDDAAREAVQMAPPQSRILDASTAHRVAPGWIYGLPELRLGQAEEIAKAKLVSNPGCYATGAVMLLRPLVEAGLIQPDQPISINAISGYSGGGKSMIAEHDAAGGPAFELYGLKLAHKHVPEVMKYGSLTRRPIFVPSVGHFPQGMIVSIPLFLDELTGQTSAESLLDVFAQYYHGQPRISVNRAPDSLQGDTLRDTDKFEIFVAGADGHAVLMARLDNLGKGASGAAVQNLALMLGLPAFGDTV